MSFNPIESILDFLEPINKYALSNDEGYKPNQLGINVNVYENEFPSLENIDVIIIGCGENRGAGVFQASNDSADAVRKELYNLYHWHKEIRIADAGNIKPGATLQDTYAALRTVVAELIHHCKKVVILGGSHDLTLAQYNVYATSETIIDATCVDALIDLNMDSVLQADNFLMRMLTGTPNFVSIIITSAFKVILCIPACWKQLIN